jgi:hypothetical protein
MCERIICRCGTEMDYDSLETTALADDNLENAVISDLEVFICSNCENKVWIYMIDNCTPVQFLTLSNQN